MGALHNLAIVFSVFANLAHNRAVIGWIVAMNFAGVGFYSEGK